MLSRLAGTVVREHVGCNHLSAEALCSMQTVKNELKPYSDFHRRTFCHVRGISIFIVFLFSIEKSRGMERAEDAEKPTAAFNPLHTQTPLQL